MTSRIVILAAAAAAAAAWAQVSRAQSLDYAAFEELFGEPVTTSVTGSPQRASAVPASMIIITADEIRRSGARDIPGVLSRYVGLDVDRHTMEHADVAVRGYNQAFTPRLLVLVDGRQVYADYYGFTPWSSIPVELGAIRQIEVVKGPNGALFGFNAVGGVINIVTYDARHDAGEQSAVVRAGTQSLTEASVTSSLELGPRTGLRLSLGARRSDEFSTPRGPGDIVTDSRNERDAVSADLHFSPSPKVTLGVEATYSRAAQSELPSTYAMSYADYETSSLRTHWEADTRFGLVKANLYRNSIENAPEVQGPAGPAFEFDNDVLVAQLEDVFKVGASHVVRVAGEYRDNSMATTPIGGATVSYDVLAVTGMWNWNLTPTLSLINAARIDRLELQRDGFLPPGFVAQTGLTNEAWDVSRDEASFNTGLVWETPASGTLQISVGRARQLPDLFNLGGFMYEVFGAYISGSPNLAPTDVSSADVRWEHELAAAGLDLEIGLFRGEARDVQSFTMNIGASDTRGVEALVGGRIGESWRWDLSLLAQDVDDDLIAGLPAEISLIDFERTVPERVAKGHLAWTRGPWEVDAFVRYESDAEGLRADSPITIDATFIPIPSHVAVDARLGVALGDNTRLSLSGRNLLRSEQRQASGLEVERQVFATVEYAF